MQAPVFLPLIFCLLWIARLAVRGPTPVQARLREDGARVCRRPLACLREALGSGTGE